MVKRDIEYEALIIKLLDEHKQKGKEKRNPSRSKNI